MANQTINFYEEDAVTEIKKPLQTTSIFTTISTQNKFNYTHTENDFIDFKHVLNIV